MAIKIPGKKSWGIWCNRDSTLVSAAVIILTLFMLLYVSFSHSDSLSAIPPNNLLSSKVNHSDIVFNFSPSPSFWKLQVQKLGRLHHHKILELYMGQVIDGLCEVFLKGGKLSDIWINKIWSHGYDHAVLLHPLLGLKGFWCFSGMVTLVAVYGWKPHFAKYGVESGMSCLLIASTHFISKPVVLFQLAFWQLVNWESNSKLGS